MSNTKLFTALVKAQAEMGKLVKDSQNPHLKNRYASLAAVLDTCRQPLANNGVALYQAASISPDMPQHVIVTSMLVHGESGESISDSLPIPLAQNTAQGIGSAITYGRRYLAMAQCGLAPDDEDDDDGNKASNKAATPQRTQPATTPKPAAATNGAQHRQPPAQAPKPVDAATAELAASVNATITNVSEFDAIPDAKASDALDKARKAFHATVVGTFPQGDTDDARHWFIEKYTTAYTAGNVRTSTIDLTATELDAMTDALKKRAKHYRDQWVVAKTAPIFAGKQTA
jgi:hypothetical protein